MTPDYQKENELRKKAVQEEEDFLKKDVMGAGADTAATTQNRQGDMEQAIEDEDTTSGDRYSQIESSQPEERIAPA